MFKRPLIPWLLYPKVVNDSVKPLLPHWQNRISCQWASTHDGISWWSSVLRESRFFHRAGYVVFIAHLRRGLRCWVIVNHFKPFLAVFPCAVNGLTVYVECIHMEGSPLEFLGELFILKRWFKEYSFLFFFAEFAHWYVRIATCIHLVFFFFLLGEKWKAIAEIRWQNDKGMGPILGSILPAETSLARWENCLLFVTFLVTSSSNIKVILISIFI